MLLYSIIADVRAAQDRDPAACSFLEVLLLYQGVYTLITYRIAHWFQKRKHCFIARFISQFSRFMTLIEIHPGARLGEGILIDHGTSIVIGEATEVGDNCAIYQDVTLGGVDTRKGKRHPTIDNSVTISAGVKILGSFEVGDNCKITANAVLLKPLQTDPTAVGVPARPVRIGGKAVEKKAHAYGTGLGGLQEKVENMQQQIDALKQELTESKEENRKRGA